MMLFVQVILGGSAVFGYIDVRYHLVWGVVTFGVLIVATAYAASELGSKSTLFQNRNGCDSRLCITDYPGIHRSWSKQRCRCCGSSNKRVCARRSPILSASQIAPTRPPPTYYHKLKPYA